MRTISNFMKNENESMDFSECIELIKLNCNIQSDLIACKVEEHTYRDYTFYQLTTESDFYEWLDNLIQECDCKNGCELREDDDGERYFSILGSCRYERTTGKYLGLDEVKVYFKNFHW